MIKHTKEKVKKDCKYKHLLTKDSDTDEKNFDIMFEHLDKLIQALETKGEHKA